MQDETWSAPESTVLSRTHDAFQRDRNSVLATVMAVKGSAYRRPGAKMLITPEEDGVGSITAGCLEDRVRKHARSVLRDGKSRIETFDLTSDEDVWGLGIGCNGIVDVLLEPIDSSIEPVLQAYDNSESVARVTVTDSEGTSVDSWQRGHYHPSRGFHFGDWSVPEWFTNAIDGQAAAITDAGDAKTVTFEGLDGDIHVFIDGLQPPPTLLIVGSQNDSRPVVDLANRNGFESVVIGFRGGTATSDRFPEADDVITTSPSEIRSSIHLDDSTYSVVMSHNFVDDRLALAELLDSSIPYIGLMGPRKRFEEMVEVFQTEGRTFSDSEYDRIYTPVGLDLGGGTPYQIAHSIVAEVLAIHNDRRPRHLKERKGPIHDRTDPDSGNGSAKTKD